MSLSRSPLKCSTSQFILSPDNWYLSTISVSAISPKTSLLTDTSVVDELYKKVRLWQPFCCVATKCCFPVTLQERVTVNYRENNGIDNSGKFEKHPKSILGTYRATYRDRYVTRTFEKRAPAVEHVAQAAQAVAGQKNQQQLGQTEQGELEVKSISRFFFYMNCPQKGRLQFLVF